MLKDKNYKTSKKRRLAFFVKNSERGFTLTEMLTAVFIFSLIIGAVFSLFISGIRGQRNAIATQQLLDQTSYVLEYMSRALRMALKEGQQDPLVGDCLDQDGFNYQINADGSSIKFINHLENDQCQEFFLEIDPSSDVGVLKQKRGLGRPLVLTSDELNVTSLKFNLIGNEQTDNLQPRVVISLKIKGRGSTADTMPEIQIQTTISQRNLDFPQ